MDNTSKTPVPSPKASPAKTSPGIKDIIEGATKIQEKGSLSPDTKKMVDELLLLCADATDEADVKIRPLQLLYKAIQKNSSLKQSLKDADMKAQKQGLLLDIGDWTAATTNAVRNAEKAFEVRDRNDRKKELKASGVSDKDAGIAVEATKNWYIAKGIMAEETFSILQTELEAVKKWRADGEDETSPPKTPGLDRIDGLCKEINIKRADFLHIVELYAERNAMAHSKPPRLEDYRKPDGTLDWKLFEGDCNGFKAKLQDFHNSGVLSKEQLTSHIIAVDTYFSLFVKAWDEDGNAVTTDYTAGVIERVKTEQAATLKRKAIPAPEFSYKKGKWDDVIPPEESKDD